MKLIVDFDDVLFDAGRLKEKFFTVLEAYGVQDPRNHYAYERANGRPFSLEGFIQRVCRENNIVADTEAIYQEVMSVCRDLRNEELVKVLMDAGKESCYIVTSGEEKFQHDKIGLSGIAEHAKVIIVVPGSKKEAIESICAQFPDETIIFIDDKPKFFSDLDKEKYPNLRTILYENHEVLALVEEEVQSALHREYEKEQEKLPPLAPEGGPKMR